MARDIIEELRRGNATPHEQWQAAKAAEAMYELLEQINREAGIVGNEPLFYATRDVLAKARGEG